MEAAVASAIAVVGTLLGTVVSFALRSRSDARAERVAHAESLRRERLEAFSAYVGAITELRRGVITLWFRLQINSDLKDPENIALLTECDRLGAAAAHARFRVQLISGDTKLMALADAAAEPVDLIRNAPNREQLVVHENQSEEALTAFITAASEQIR
ncbi:MAG: hypothetical protein ACRDWG_11900 [Actinomycetes bacterium]|jgi:hypothetical protein